MAETFAGDIKIGTTLDTKSAEQSLNAFRAKMKSAFDSMDTKTLQENLRKTEKIISSLETQINKTKSKLAELNSGDVIPKSVVSMEKELQKAQSEMDKLDAQFQKLSEEQAALVEGVPEGLSIEDALTPEQLARFEELDRLIIKNGEDTEVLQNKIDALKSKLDQIKSDPTQSDEAQKLTAELEEQTAELQKQINLEQQLKQEVEERATAEEKQTRYKRESGGADIPSIASNAGAAISGLGNRILKLAGTVFVFNQISKGLRMVRDAIGEVIANDTMLSSALNTIKANLAAAFQPIWEAVLPALQALMSFLVSATAALAKFIAMLFGKSVNVAAKKTAGAVGKATKALGGAGKAAEEAGEAAEDAAKSMLDFDELNIIQTDKDSDSGGGKGGSGGGGGGDAGGDIGAEYMEADTSGWDKLLDILRQIADIFMSGFWNGFQYADWDGLKESIKSIGQSLKEIFTDPEVVNSAQNFAKTVIYVLGEIVGSSAAIGVNIATGILGGLAKTLEEHKSDIKRWLIDMFDVNSETLLLWGDLFVGLANISRAFSSESGKEFFGSIWELAGTVGGNILLLASKLGRDISYIFTKPITDNADKIEVALENILKPAATAIKSVTGLFETFFGTVQKLYDDHISPFFKSIGDGFSKIFGTLLDVFNEYFAPVLKELADDLGPALEKFRPGIESLGRILGDFFDNLSGWWTAVLVPIIQWLISVLGPVLATVVGIVGDTINTVISVVGTLFSGIVEVLEGILNFITAVFSGDWEGAWDALTDIFEAWKGIFLGLWDTIHEYIDGVWQRVKDLWQPAFDALANVWGNVADWFKEKWDKIKSGANEVKTSISNSFKAAYTAVKNAFSKIGSWFKERWKSVKDVFSSSSDGVKSKFKDWFEGGYNNMKTAFSSIGSWATETWKKVTDVFGNNSDGTEGKFKSWFEGGYKNMDTAFSNISEWASGTWKKVTDIFGDEADGTAGKFKSWFEGGYKNMDTAFNGISEWATGTWKKVTDVFGAEDGGVLSGFKGWFTDAYEAITGENGIFSGWSNFFSGLWTTVKEKFTDFGQKMGEAVSGALKNAVNAAISTVERIINGAIRAINSAIGLINLIPGVNVGTIGEVSLPRLAKGAVIPPNQEFLAVLGDQKSGTNIEAPLATIKQAVREELDNRNLQGNGGNININFTGNLAQLARILKPEIDREASRRGVNLIVGGGF